MSNRLWSPQMRKWVKDANLHGTPIQLYKERHRIMAGGGNPYTERLTDDGILRILDSPAGRFGSDPRNIDRPI